MSDDRHHLGAASSRTVPALPDDSRRGLCVLRRDDEGTHPRRLGRGEARDRSGAGAVRVRVAGRAQGCAATGQGGSTGGRRERSLRARGARCRGQQRLVRRSRHRRSVQWFRSAHARRVETRECVRTRLHVLARGLPGSTAMTRSGREDSAWRALFVLFGWCAVLFGVLLIPFAVFVFAGDDGVEVGSSPYSTIPPLPRNACEPLREIEAAGAASERVVLNTNADRAAWPRARASIDHTLARYEFLLQTGRPEAPPLLRDDFGIVARNVHVGRAKLVLARDADDYRRRVIGDMTSGAAALFDAYDRLGRACGRPFT